MTKVFVRVTSPTSQFQQEVNGQVEHVRAQTNPNTGLQEPVPCEVTLTKDLERALRGDAMRRAQPDPFAPIRPATIVLCTSEEVEAHLASRGESPRKQLTPDLAPALPSGVGALRDRVMAAVSRARAAHELEMNLWREEIGPRFRSSLSRRVEANLVSHFTQLERDVAELFAIEERPR